MKIGFIGTGNMGGAILKGYAKSSASAGNDILIHNKLSEHNSVMAEAMAESGNTYKSIRICNDNIELAEEADIIIIGVKPSSVDEVLSQIAPCLAKSPEKIVVSMAAGVSIASMETMLNEAKPGCSSSAKLIRIMPNTPAQVEAAMTAMSRNANVSDEDFALAKTIFDAIGRAEGVPEDMIDCVIGVSGSSPAYTYMYLEALTKAAAANGMEPEQARIFACQAVIGAAKLALESRESLEQLRINVCSPGGTTIEAVKKLQANGFMDDVIEGFQAAVDRSKEMTGQ